MTVFEITSVAGLFIGPVAAAAWTVLYQESLRRKIAQHNVVVRLLNVHHDYSDPEFSSAMRLIPVEFQKNAMVMSSWKEWMKNVNFRPSPENQNIHSAETDRLKLILLRSLALAVGLRLNESDITYLTYVAQGYTDKVAFQNEALGSLKRIADSLERIDKNPDATPH